MEYEITSPDGRRFIVTAPEGASQQDVLRYAQQNMPQPPSAARQIAGNVAGAAARGVSNLVGLPGDIAQGIDRGAQWLARQAGIDVSRPAPPPGYEWLPDLSSGVTSGMVREGARAVGVPVDQRAETAGGRIAQDAIEGAASAPFGAASAIYGAISGGAGGAAAEGARELGFGDTGQTVARVAGAVAAPVAAGRIAGAWQRTSRPPPTTEELRAQSQAAYARAHGAGVQIAPASAQTMAQDLTDTLRREGFNPRLHPRAATALDELTQAAAAGQPLDLQQVDILRRVAAAAGKSIEPDERRVATLIIDKIDEWVNGLKPSDVLSGNSPAAAASLNEARSLWGRSRRGELLEDLIDRAKLRASQFSGSGLENALRTEFRQLAMNEKRLRGFSPAERQAIEAVSRGGPLVNILRMLGKFAPTGVVSGALGGGVGAAIGGAPGAVAVPLAGAAARAGATQMTMTAAQRAAETARAGGALPQSTAEAISEAIALLSAEREAMRFGDPTRAAAPPPTTTR